MLRNFYPPVRVVEICLLNEVLSLNAQEFLFLRAGGLNAESSMKS